MLSLVCAVLALGAPVAREVSFPGFEDLTLKGTLLLPSGAKKVPAVLLLPGSGPTDRDGNAAQLGFHPDVLKQIAESLAANGIGSLRFDKRATMGYRSSWPKTPDGLDHFFRFEAFTGDAEAALGYLRSLPEVSPTHTGIVGHSEGSLYALYLGNRLAGTPKRVSALGLLGCTGRTMDRVIMDQLRAKLQKQLPPDQIPPYLDYAERALAAAKASQPFPPDPPTGLGGLFNSTVRSLIHSYVTIDPVVLAKGYDGSAIVINGEFDNQVSAVRDAKPVYEALHSRKKGASELLIAAKASHNLKVATSLEDEAFDGPIVQPVLPRLAAFLKAKL